MFERHDRATCYVASRRLTFSCEFVQFLVGFVGQPKDSLFGRRVFGRSSDSVRSLRRLFFSRHLLLPNIRNILKLRLR